jgi:hypothetical protein
MFAHYLDRRCEAHLEAHNTPAGAMHQRLDRLDLGNKPIGRITLVDLMT